MVCAGAGRFHHYRARCRNNGNLCARLGSAVSVAPFSAACLRLCRCHLLHSPSHVWLKCAFQRRSSRSHASARKVQFALRLIRRGRLWQSANELSYSLFNDDSRFARVSPFLRCATTCVCLTTSSVVPRKQALSASGLSTRGVRDATCATGGELAGGSQLCCVRRSPTATRRAKSAEAPTNLASYNGTLAAGENTKYCSLRPLLQPPLI